MIISRTSVLSILLAVFLFSGCQKKKETNNQAYWDIITHRTLGLAYLEENKLDEAETEFLALISLSPEEPLGYANLGLVYLRKGMLDEAEDQLDKAIDLDAKDPGIRLMRARAYELNSKPEEAIEDLEEAIDIDPNHVKSLYQLAEIYANSEKPDAPDIREKYLKRIIEVDPTNLAPRMNLVSSLIDKMEYDQALQNLEEIKRLYPELPKESVEYYNRALAGLQNGEFEEARVAFLFLHNYLKVTASYQAGLQNLKGPGGMLIGVPIITFSQNKTENIAEGTSIIGALKFTDVTEQLGLGQAKMTGMTPHLAIGDYENDGRQDIYFGNSEGQYLYRNDPGKFLNTAPELNISPDRDASDAIFVDYDNDGHLDLFVTTKDRAYLYHNRAKGVFAEVATEAGLMEAGNANASLFFDYDQDGDLDLFQAKEGRNGLFRNNSDGTFSNLSNESTLTEDVHSSKDAVFGDFDEDGDTDLFIVNDDGNNTLYSNMRQGIFEDISSKAGIEANNGSIAVSAGDYNNDGFLDIFISGKERGDFQLYQNRNDGTFNLDPDFSSTQALNQILGEDSRFWDFDNDGFLDLIITGTTSGAGKRGVVLLHNEGDGNFTDTSSLLPSNIESATRAEAFDFDEDGDLDLLLAFSGSLHLLRNDGGNVNHHLQVQLVGLRAGSGKNNYFGIGAKIEMRSGDLYQMQVVTDPVVHFGLGQRTSADVVRILWTNGVPQNIFTPESDQDLVEQQILKGSCPFLYTWNGEKFVFTKDIMWRSALGMPMGIMAGEKKYAFPDASRDYIKIPGESLKEKDGKLTIQVTEELWETVYYDQAQLIAVDHPASMDIFVDEKFITPPFPEIEIYSVEKKLLPVSAEDQDGNDLLQMIAQKDNNYISNIGTVKFQGITEPHDLILDLGRLPKNQPIRLYLNGWIFPSDASINVNVSQSDNNKVHPPSLQVMNEFGEWETVMNSLGFPMGKNKTVIADLTGLFKTEQHKIRIQTNMQIYWDYVFYTVGESNVTNSIRTTEMLPETADLHYRGFSASFRKGGRYGPHWFDYYQVETGQRWRDLTGNYTRYGDVTDLLLEADNKYIIANAGEEVTIQFDAKSLPELPDGWKRDYLIYSVGWVKDGDLNTAYGNTVEPLPFHEMTRYPYGQAESYPVNPELEVYRKKYNNRKVTTDQFRNAVIGSE